MKPLPEIEHVSTAMDSKGYTSRPIPRLPGTPMPPEEVIARLEHLFKECRDSYHYHPSKEDEEAVKLAADAVWKYDDLCH